MCKIKKSVISLAVAFLPVIAMSSAYASSGTITFNGEVTSSTCEVGINGGNADATVTLPTVPTSALPADATTAGRTTFTINLSNCVLSDPHTKVVAFFEGGASVDPTTGRLINTAGTAENVSLQLVDGVNSNPINAGDETQRTSNTAATVSDLNKATLPYAVQYYAEGAAAGAGSVNSHVTYSIHYQ